MNDVPLVIHPVVLLSNCKKLNALQSILFYPAYNGQEIEHSLAYKKNNLTVV